MRAAALGLALALAACAPGNRDRSVPMQSIAAFDASRLAGQWHLVGRFPEAGIDASCLRPVLDFAPAADGGIAVRSRCGAVAAEPRRQGTARPVGPGRLELAWQGEAARTYWVLWVDEGYRTAVLGMPSGEAGWVLDRAPEIPPDRLRAAREVLAWNGYDPVKLRMEGQ